MPGAVGKGFSVLDQITGGGGIFSGASSKNPLIFFENALGKGKGGGIGTIPFPQIGGAAATEGGLLGAVTGGLSAAAPWIAGGLLAYSVIKSLLPNPKAQFQKEQNAALFKDRYIAPGQQTGYFDVATGGKPLPNNIYGQARIIVQQPVNVHISAIDTNSLTSRAADIADVIGYAVSSGASPSMQNAIVQTVFGPGGG